MVSFKEIRHTKVDCACSSDNVPKCKKSCENKQLVQSCVQFISRCPSRLSTKLPTIHYCLGSIVS